MSARAGVPADSINMHASAVILGDRGIVITGPSGAGKTALALDLIARWRRSGRHATLIADDQVFVAARGLALVCFAPANIAGLVEARGFGPARVDHADAGIVDLKVELAGEADRMLDRAAEAVEICGIALPRLVLPPRDIVGSSLAIEAWLGAVGLR